MKIVQGKNVPIKIWTNDIEDEALNQLNNLSHLPFIHKHIAVMPDCHAGIGSTVGTVVATKGAIIPACCGVDIGCGMMALKLPFKVDILKDLGKLRHSIERSIPVGRNSNKTISNSVDLITANLWTLANETGSTINSEQLKKASYQIGTLGGGNHFIEICQDKDDGAWIVLHSGSRNIGKVLAEKHIDKAKDLMKQYFISLPDPNLAYLAQGTPEFKTYLSDLMLAQKFALHNREEMMDKILREILYHVGLLNTYKDTKDSFFKVNCHHNYTSLENHFGANIYVTRKGAVSAKEGEWGIIPGSMGTRSYIVKGLGNNDSFHSCSHGAGRKMSRTKARATFTVDDLKQQTLGVECRKDSEVVDEIPGAYKDIDVVMENQKDLVTPVFELKQLLCIKG